LAKLEKVGKLEKTNQEIKMSLTGGLRYSQNERGKGSLPERLSSQGLPAPAAAAAPREVFHQLPDWLEKCKFVRSLNYRVCSGHTNWNATVDALLKENTSPRLTIVSFNCFS
jgi:hypothetical protein